MALPSGTNNEFIISPRDTCAACHSPTGPKFTLYHLRGPSENHRENITPTGSERQSVKSSIASAYVEAAQLDEEILRLQTSLETLIERRDALYKFAKQEESLFAPIRKLPADVLRQIFLNIFTKDHYISCDDLEEFPRIITQVSAYWRSVAHSCAHLWSNVIARRYQEKFGPTYGELIRKCVMFSNELPMTVELWEEITLSVLGSDCARALGQCAYRWKTMLISEDELSKAVFACIPANTSFYELKRLRFNLSASVVIGPSPKLTDLTITGVRDLTYSAKICSAESLVDVTIKSIGYPLSTLIGMPWSQITNLEASDIIYQDGEFIDLLDKLKNVVSLSLKEATDTFATGSVTMPRLESLSLGDYDVETNVMEIVTAPNLKSLTLACEFDCNSVVDFAERSKFSLDFFKIHDMEIDDVWASPEFETVKYLFWENPRFVGSGIEWLTNDDAPSPAEVFPRVEWLQINNLRTYREEDDEWTVEDIISMLESRMPVQDGDDPAITGRYLKMAVINIAGFLKEEEVESFKEFFHSDAVRRSRVVMTVTHSGGLCIDTVD